MTDDTTGDDSLLLDADALRALAHPLRIQLLEQLSEQGPSTASQLGRAIGESSGSTSYHLRQLAAHGLIIEAPEMGTGRERFWRSRPGGWTLRGFEMRQTQPEVAHDVDVVLDGFRRARAERLARWYRESERWGTEWVDASIDTLAFPLLTRAELAELRDELLAVISRWQQAVGQRTAGGPVPEGAVPVAVVIDAFPTGEPPESPADPTDQTEADTAS